MPNGNGWKWGFLEGNPRIRVGTGIGKRIGLEWVEEFYPVKGSTVRDNVAVDGNVSASSSVPEREETEIEPLFAGDVPESAGDVPECAAVDSPVSTPQRSATVSATVSDSSESLSDNSESVSDVSAECFRTTVYSRLAIREVSRKRSRMFVKLTKIQYSSRHISPFSTSARNRARSQTRTVGTGSTAMQPFISTRRRADTSPST